MNYNMTSNAAVGQLTKPSDSNLRQQMDSMDKEIAELSTSLGELTARLSPVLQPETPTSAAGAPPPVHPFCPIANALAGFRLRLSDIRATLGGIHQRLDI